jgi:peptidoglycan/LPS O-acetylase OafA/YrhL
MRMIDGLRGIAAFAVVLHHLEGATTLGFGPWAPAWLEGLLRRGFLGVDIFFVLSGFVIAYSLRSVPPSWGFVGRFALRRSIRLDPPYWASIAIEVTVAALVAAAGYATWKGVTLPQVLSHLAYVQEFVGHPHINAVYWTLCFEIQFYLTLVVLAVIAAKMQRRWSATVVRRLAIGTFGVLFVVSLAGRFGPLEAWMPRGLALIRWYQFAIGALVWWTHAGAAARGWLYAAWAALGIAVVGQPDVIEQLLPVVVSGAIVLALDGDRMQRWLSLRWLQFLGAISYSLYLFHATVGWRSIRLLGLVLPTTPWYAALAFLLGTAAAVGFCWVMWLVIERPSLGWSRHVRLVPRTDPAGSVPVAA